MSELHLIQPIYEPTDTEPSEIPQQYSAELSASFHSQTIVNQDSNHSYEDTEYSLKRIRLNNGEDKTILHATHIPTNQTVSVDFHKFLTSDISPIQERTDEHCTNFSTEEKPLGHRPVFQLPEEPPKMASLQSCLSPPTMFSKHTHPTHNSDFKPLKAARDDYFSYRGTQTPGSLSTRSITKKLSTPKSPQLRTKSRVRPEKALSEMKPLQEIKEHSNRFKESKSKGVQSASKDLSFTRKADTHRHVVVLPAKKEGTRSLVKISSDKKPDIRPRLSSTDSSESYHFKARPMPVYLPFEVKKSDKPCVIPTEPKLATEERGRMKARCQKEEYARKKELENCTRTFKALPLPDFSKLNHSSLNHHHHHDHHKPTIPMNIHLHTDERAELHKSCSIDQSSMDSLNTTRFKASPMPDFSKPFVPKLGTSPLTEVEEIVLCTQIRAEKRENFEKQMLEKLNEREAQRKKEEEERAKREREEIERWRKAVTLKANSFTSPITLKMSSRSMALPTSPRIGKRNFDALQKGGVSH